ncbi:MAG: Crp/Fnr family transcriptional regulator [Pseudomonadota bacterium]|nr:Crp/Fnr family transcriptional regulator [Pseudomonadota bacterium]
MSAHSIPDRCEHCTIRHRAICAALNKDELTSMNRIARQRLVNAGQVISADSEPGIAFANIVSGVVKLTKMLADGRQQIVGLQFPPDFLGRTFMDANPFTAEAATDVELCSFPKKEFEAVLRRYPGLEHRLFSDTLNELDAAREWMLLLGRKTAQEKVASFLMLLANRASNVGCSHSDELHFAQFHLPLTRADMADYLGLTLETVSRQMTRLRSAGAISLAENREVVVPEMDRLRELAGD